MVRDPTDPCHRLSTGPFSHSGVFAVSDVPKHTIVCEYGGLLRREDEGGSNPNPEYAIKLEKCGAYVLDSSSSSYENAYILDGECMFNEGSVINDFRWSLDGQDGSVYRKENVLFLEVVVNDWPHIFVVKTIN